MLSAPARPPGVGEIDVWGQAGIARERENVGYKYEIDLLAL